MSVRFLNMNVHIYFSWILLPGSYPVTGLVHVSELSWDRIYDPRDVVQEGQSVEVKVTGIDL